MGHYTEEKNTPECRTGVETLSMFQKRHLEITSFALSRSDFKSGITAMPWHLRINGVGERRASEGLLPLTLGFCALQGAGSVRGPVAPPRGEVNFHLLLAAP